jgi:hypothetical protein
MQMQLRSRLTDLRQALVSSIPLTIAVAIAAVLLCFVIRRPFIGHHEYNSAWMSTAARNHLRYGYTVTRLGVTENNDFVLPEWLHYYIDHPPLVPPYSSLFHLAYLASTSGRQGWYEW